MDPHGLTNSLPPMDPHDLNHPTFYTAIDSSHQTPPPSTIYHHQFVTPPSNKPRGRPVGSKNKPKSPLMVNQANEQALKPVIIEVPAETDVVEAVIKFARRHRVSITVLSASGFVSDVTLSHTHFDTPTFSIRGPFNLISLTGTYIYNTHVATSLSSSSSSNPDVPPCSFKISFSGISGQSFTGVVGGKVVAANRVIVVATTFNDPEIHKAKVNDSGPEENNNNKIFNDAYGQGDNNASMFGLCY